MMTDSTISADIDHGLGEVRITIQASGVDQFQGNALEDDLETDDLLDDTALCQEAHQASREQSQSQGRACHIQPR